jgi:hypothetical protein
MKNLVLAFCIFILNLSCFAHEGMWIPSLLKALEGDMQSKGLRLSTEQIYSINKSSLKDAIVHFGGGCTAEVVSSEGLIFTNHHCGYSQIQAHSSLENNYLKDGFWAMSRREELKNPGLTATFIVRIEDVTALVNKHITIEMDKKTAYNSRQEAIKKITNKAISGTDYNAKVLPFYYGNEYYMIVSKTYKDVRLVGAPPSSMGKFGKDTDNWIWPRHTCDFSVFRIYSDKDNNPSDISDDNVPYSPLHHLPISLQGVKEGDFTMVFGFPGRTSQFLTSYAVDDYIKIINPARIKMRETSLSVIDASMKSSEALFIKYASKQSRISNAYKKWIGQNLGLKKKDALKIKQTFEGEYLKRAPRGGKYKNILQEMKLLQTDYTRYDQAKSLFVELWYYGPEIIRFSSSFDFIADGVSPDLEKIDKKKKNINNYFKNYDLKTDKEVFTKLLKLYFEFLEDELESEIREVIKTKYNDDFKAYANFIYDKSNFTSKEKASKLLSLGNKQMLKKLEKDPAYILSKSILNKYIDDIKPKYSDLYYKMEDYMKLYVEAQMKYFPEKTFWADANSTLRLTYGKVESTVPRDGMKYTPTTTLDGIIEKNNTGNPDFEIPDRLRTLWQNKDYGRYAEKGKLNICLLGSNHTTGGNSGSPTINGYGHLIGINFDRSWESTMSDIMFDEDICRNIMVDIRYVLWVIDKYAGAGYLVDEMTIVDDNVIKKQEIKQLKIKISQLSNELKALPNDLTILTARFKAYLELGNKELALIDLNTAVENYPKNYKLLNIRASYYIEENMLEKAKQDVEKSLKIYINSEAYLLKSKLLEN